MKDMPLAELAQRYEVGESVAMLGRVCDRHPTTIWARLVAAGVKMRRCGAPIRNKNALGHKGPRKRGGPLSLNRDGYFCTIDRTGYPQLVHRACWEVCRGTIPEGHVVHHINGDVTDNRIENLACMLLGEHTRMHAAERRTRCGY